MRRALLIGVAAAMCALEFACGPEPRDANEPAPVVVTACAVDADCPAQSAEPSCGGIREVVRPRVSRACVDGLCQNASVQLETLHSCAGETWCREGACAPLWGGLHGQPVDRSRAARLLFIGNSYTYYGPVPTLVRQLAAAGGWPEPVVEHRAVSGATLANHRADTATLGLVDRGGWDFVVLQDHSTRPTDATGAGGNPIGFKSDATWFFDRIKVKSPAARVILYETWARHRDHAYFPTYYTDSIQMQAQLRFHYNDAAEHFLPSNAVAAPAVWVAPVGDAWERHLRGPDALRLHDADDHHASPHGQYLNAAVLYSSIYNCASTGLPALLSLAAADVALLQADADATTGAPQCSSAAATTAVAVGP